MCFYDLVFLHIGYLNSKGFTFLYTFFELMLNGQPLQNVQVQSLNEL